MENDSQKTPQSSAPAADAGAAEGVCRFPGRVRGRGKGVEQLKKAVRRMLLEYDSVIAAGVAEKDGEALVAAFPGGEYDPVAEVFLMPPREIRTSGVFIVTAGEEDLPAALGARYALAACGAAATVERTGGTARPETLRELGDRLRCAAACIAVAGADSALPAAVSGMVGTPVIALPVSVPGDSPGGWELLPGILRSGAPGLAVTLPDDGVGAGFAAARIINGTAAGTNMKDQN
ncbi:MAG: AIR carboxylase family protein [Lentisphaeria bacterium]|nr:AIR carboxylase family protein [Lentisphaeria bacterium]